MSLTCVQKILNTVLIAAVSSCLCVSANAAPKKAEESKSVIFEAPAQGVIQVSDYDLNTFVFPDSIKAIHFPDGIAASKPIYMANNTQAAIQFGKIDKDKKYVQMIVELVNGNTSMLKVLPAAVPGIWYTVTNKEAIKPSVALKGRNSAMPQVSKADPRGDDVELLKLTIIGGEPPEPFEALPLPKPTAFDKFSVVPLNAWSNGSDKRIHSFSIVAAPGQTAVIAPTMFYREGISAIVLDGETVDDNNSPILYVVEEIVDGE